jgi:pimeloyl-ACP methyl ester carboxylesterase
MKNLLIPSAWKKLGTFLSYRDQQIFLRYEPSADKPALLLIHGFPTASWDWSMIWEELSAHFSLIAIDMIGFGFSDKPRRYTYSIFDQAELHAAVLNQLGIKKVQLLVHDYGVTVAQELLARQLERKDDFTIEQMVFLNGGLFPETHQPQRIQKLLASPIGPILGLLMSKKSLTRTFHNIFGPNTPPSEEEMDHFWELLTYNQGKMVIPKLIGYMAERRIWRERWVGALQKTPIPLRLINGCMDPISGRHLAERYQVLVPNPVVVLLEDIGHYPQVEAPDRVLKAFFDFQA